MSGQSHVLLFRQLNKERYQEKRQKVRLTPFPCLLTEVSRLHMRCWKYYRLSECLLYLLQVVKLQKSFLGDSCGATSDVIRLLSDLMLLFLDENLEHTSY